MIEGLANVLKPTDNNNKYTLVKMKNETIHYTQILPQLVQQMQKMHKLIAHIQTKLNNTNKMVETKTTLVAATIATRSHFEKILLLDSWYMK